MIKQSIAALFFIFYPLFTLASPACKDVETRMNTMDKDAKVQTSVKTQKLCFDDDDTRVWSGTCEKKECEAWYKLSGAFIEVPEDQSEIGTPGGKVCRGIQGLHRLVEIKLNGKWVEDGFCIFEEDSSFVNDAQALWLTQQGYAVRPSKSGSSLKTSPSSSTTTTTQPNKKSSQK